jgi:hypothetical protein
MTVSEALKITNLQPCGPVRWMTAIREFNTGVYIVARTDDPHSGCKSYALPLRDTLQLGLRIDCNYESARWLPKEPIIYIGATNQPLAKRVCQFYQHKCGDRHPHAGGQITLLLHCDLWLYWAPANHPFDCEEKMLCAFRDKIGQLPFANSDGKRRPGGRVHF